ncbi:MAG: alanine--tRNA ligase, partial [Vicinamibacterales bacterium]
MPRTSTAQATRTAAQVRQQFIDFFVARHGHTFVPGSPVAPHDDPTLLFTNAGMNQFKDVFLDQGSRDYRRAVNSQKCIRAGGKHNDLEEVGQDHYHHTFFEMLGNWSFGDYFKAEAIEWAWELLTSPPPGGWGIDKNRLYVTVFEGDEAEGIEPDVEAENLWARYIDPARISRWGRKDNFWEMGETGPCGPCSEIHYDFTPDNDGAGLVNLGDPRVIELWNLVFIQFNRGRDGRLTPLSARHVDTGMGLERLVRVIQHKDSNYDIDLFTPIFQAIEAQTGAHAYRGTLDDPLDIAYRVIADHIRCLTAAITDGAWPGNEGRGYVLRRILRRAVRHAHQTLQSSGAWLHELVPTVVDTLADAFPEFTEKPDTVAMVIRDEEESFLGTLDRGIALFEEAASGTGAGQRLSAQDAFKLHDTYGFPIDLTRVMALERGISVDETGFETLMEQARQRSRRGAGDTGSIDLPPDAIARLKQLGIEPTNDDARDDARPMTAKVKAIFNGNDFDEVAEVGTTVAMILNRTNHYAQAGGQVGDQGDIVESSETQGEGHLDAHFSVQDTRGFGGYVLHIGHVTEHALRVGAPVNITVDRSRRTAIRANHTATHLLNFALRRVIGPEEDQRGSLVAPDRLRFDFTC